MVGIGIGIGILAGLLAGSRLADLALRRGHTKGCVLVPAPALLASVPVLAPGTLLRSPVAALPLLVAGLLDLRTYPRDAATPLASTEPRHSSSP